MNLMEALQDKTNFALTQNGATANFTTKSSVLDFFSQAGAMRGKTEEQVTRAFDKAFEEDSVLALKCLFYIRDLRGGQGERQTFRHIIKWLAKNHTDRMKALLEHIPEFGRWDDMFVLIGTKLEKEAIDLVRSQLNKDMSSDQPSLLAKWMPTINHGNKVARKLRDYFGVTSAQYAKILVNLRTKLNIIEHAVSDKSYKFINYQRVPSRAAMVYRKAFMKHDKTRYEKFLEAVKKGEKKINAAALYPYDIVRGVFGGKGGYETLDAQWNALPNWCGDDTSNTLCVVDTSGSMQTPHNQKAVIPMYVALSLGIYIAERNHGLYHNKFITFSSKPTLQAIKGSDIRSKALNLNGANWSMNTNLEAVFALILNSAVENKLSQEDMPARIIIISDMEFDRATYVHDDSSERTLMENIEKRFVNAGYKMPRLVYWNVDVKEQQFPVTMSKAGTVLVSGASPSIYKSIVSNQYVGPYEMMLETLNSERYKAIR